MKTEVFKISQIDSDLAKRIADNVRNGALMVFPSDTVYGIATNALLAHSSQKIYEIKNRPQEKPLPILVDSIGKAKEFSVWNKNADILAKAFWPGSLTMILNTNPNSDLAISPAYKYNIGLRLPNHDFLINMIGLIKSPLASTSANMSGEREVVLESSAKSLFDGKVDYVLLGGNLPGTPSTVVDVCGDRPKILRKGSIDEKEIFEKIK
jgi:L-threonylcarbamoyladenylate synthase